MKFQKFDQQKELEKQSEKRPAVLVTAKWELTVAAPTKLAVLSMVAESLPRVESEPVAQLEQGQIHQWNFRLTVYKLCHF